MFVLIWATLLFSVRVSDAKAGSSVLAKQSCTMTGYCNTLVEGNITAEAGLCVEIPCSFTVPTGVKISHIVWFKCESTEERCKDEDMIFNSDTSSDKVQSEFKRRVSLLESDVSQKNCSIIINDLKESDSGRYQHRVEALPVAGSLTFRQTATVSVQGLSQRPTVMIPPLTEGQPTTLTCTAPGLCSGSEPTFTWRWRGRGESDADLTGNITAIETEKVTEFPKRSSSTLSFSPSAEHHGTNITCTVLFKGNVSTEETVTLSVTYVRITQNANVSEGETLNLTCKVEGFPPSRITWTKVIDESSRKGTGTTLLETTFSDPAQLTEERGTATLSLFNVTADDAGQYVCTVTHMNSTWKKNVNVTVIYMRDPVITGDLEVKEGDVLNLTCRVNSFPPSHVAWTNVSDQSSRKGTGTTLRETSFNDSAQLTEERGTATLSLFNVTAEDAGQYVCTVTHMNRTWTKDVNVTVIYMRDPVITGELVVKEGDVLNLACRVNSFPPSHVAWTKVFDQSSRKGTGTTLRETTFNDSAQLSYTEERGTATLSLFNVKAEDAGQYVCTMTHVNSPLKKDVNVTVIYMRDPVITGNLSVKEGAVLNLTCRGNSFPPSVVAWTEFDSSTNPPKGTDLKNDSGSSTFIISNVTAEHSGHYICTAKHGNRTTITTADVVVTWGPKILNSSNCVVQSGVLTCVCISEGLPLPTVKWPLLEDQTAYSVINTVSNYTVNRTVSVKGRNDSSVQCVSVNTNGEARKNCNQIKSPEHGDQPTEVLERWFQTIVAFVIGVLLTAVVFCLAKRCSRKKQKSPDSQHETIDMVTNPEDPLVHNGQAAQDAETRGRKRAEAGSVAAGASAPELNSGPQDEDYASIDFSLLKSKRSRDAANQPETTETDYAEIQKQVKKEREDGGAEEGEVLEEAGRDEEAEESEEEETNNFVPEEEEAEAMAVYSNVKDLMAEM